MMCTNNQYFRYYADQSKQCLTHRRAVMNRIVMLLSAVLITISCAPSDDAVEVRNREVVRAVFSEIWSKGNIDLIPERSMSSGSRTVLLQGR